MFVRGWENVIIALAYLFFLGPTFFQDLDLDHKRAKREDGQLPPLPLEGAKTPESSGQWQLFWSLVSKPCMGSLFVTEMYMCYKQTDRHRRQYS